MSTQFTLPEMGHKPQAVQPRRYVKSDDFQGMNHQPGGSRRSAPKKKTALREEILCGNKACGKMFTRRKFQQRGCSPECRAVISAEKAKAYYEEVRASKNGVLHCASDEKAIEVWNRPRPGQKSLAEQEEAYYTASMSPKQRQEWRARQAAIVAALREGMGL